MIKKISDTIVALFFYATGGLCFGFWAIVIPLVSLFHTGSFFELLLKGMCRSVLFCSGIRLEIEGLENVVPGRQYILMMNHINIFDPFMGYARFPGRARGIEEESHFNWPIYGWVIRRIGQIAINRKSGVKALGALQKAADLIRKQEKYSIAILPEGTRTRTGKLGAFKRGGFLLAIESGLDILPMIQVGALKIKKKGNWRIRPGKVRMILEPPISTKEFSKENVRELMEKTRQIFLKYID